MTVAGVVAEYNPFHPGHAFHLGETRRALGECAVVAVMSGNFVQRGECAVFDKWTRARAALEGGADLVLELPTVWAASSAETAALWEETLAPYEPFGLTWTFDDPDLDGNGLTMTWEGHEVRGIYDEGKFSWITEHAGDGAFGPDAVELYTIYENGKLTGLRLASEEEIGRASCRERV